MRGVLDRLSRSAVILALALSITPLAAAPARAHGEDADHDGPVVHVCVDRFGPDRGEIRLVSRFEKCPFGTSRIVWNLKGQQGPRGDRGPIGPQGPAGPAGGEGDPERLIALEQAVATLQAQIATLQGLLTLAQHLRVETGALDGLAGPHVIVEGANVHVRSGSGATRDNGTPTGLGNLIVGYNEPMAGAAPGYRGGSHNLVVGPEHLYSSTGGFVAGFANGVAGESASVGGGSDNLASGPNASVAGGVSNTASGDYASILGGEFNTAQGFGTTVAGGRENVASGGDSSVSGGTENTASGLFSVVGGGSSRTAGGMSSWAAGSLLEAH
jgi:hypothetical protein